MPDLRARLRHFLSELRRRRVLRVALAYAAAGWGALQLADVLADPFHLPDWTIPLLVMLCVVGFPVALALAWAFDLTPHGLTRAAPEPAESEASTSAMPAAGVRAPAVLSRRGRWVFAGVALLALAGTGAWLLRQRPGSRGAALDPDLMVVLPFRVAGADPSVRYLREGMLDLLATKLSASGGKHVLDPRSLMSAWRRSVGSEAADLPPDSALELADRLGAGTLVLGEVVSAPGRIVLTASVRRVGEDEAAPAVSVEGPSDSLLVLVDRLAAGILSVGAGQEPERMAYLTTASLPALRAYLNGQALYRQARPEAAMVEYRRALTLDSTFALAALGLYQAIRWGINEPGDARALRLAWNERARLGPRDRALLLALAGPRYPEEPPVGDRIAALRALVEFTPDRAEAWLELGDVLWHYGPLVDIRDSREQARDAFLEAIQLDPGLTFALFHLAGIADALGDTAGFRRYSTLLRAQTGSGVYLLEPVYLAASHGDPAALASLHTAVDTGGAAALATVLWYAELNTLDRALADRAALRAGAAPGTPQERYTVHQVLYARALNGGRPGEALRWGDSLVVGRRAAPFLIEHAIFWDGSATAAATAAAMLEHGLPDSLSVREQYDLALWQLRHGNTRNVRTALQRLARADPARSPTDRQRATLSVNILEALLAATTRASNAPALIERLDSALGTGPAPMDLAQQGNLVLAELHLNRGDARGALRAARRRFMGASALQLYSTALREHARAALAAGEREEAGRAAARYLRLRSDPEPALRPEVEAFRREFAALARENGS